MNAAGALVTAGVLAVVAAVLGVLELPHPATASAASAAVRITLFMLT